jgi:hypothetical protein
MNPYDELWLIVAGLGLAVLIWNSLLRRKNGKPKDKNNNDK